jgi:hypothetical protein
MTKVAFGATSIDDIAAWAEARGRGERMVMTTRYLPKRHAEMIGGSLFWILKHKLVGRSPIISFGEAEGGRVAIHLEPRLILVAARPKRAHQGWRYLEDKDAPADLGEGDAAELPHKLVGELAAIGLL